MKNKERNRIAHCYRTAIVTPSRILLLRHLEVEGDHLRHTPIWTFVTQPRQYCLGTQPERGHFGRALRAAHLKDPSQCWRILNVSLEMYAPVSTGLGTVLRDNITQSRRTHPRASGDHPNGNRRIADRIAATTPRATGTGPS